MSSSITPCRRSPRRWARPCPRPTPVCARRGSASPDTSRSGRAGGRKMSESLPPLGDLERALLDQLPAERPPLGAMERVRSTLQASLLAGPPPLADAPAPHAPPPPA